MTDLKKLLDEATPLPWYVADWTSDDGLDLTTIEARAPEVLRPGQSSIWPDGIECSRVAETNQGNNPLEDAALIVAAVNAVPELLAIKQAVSDYHFALDSREHGGVAANRLVDAVQSALGQHWVCGAEAERRAALNQEPGQ